MSPSVRHVIAWVLQAALALLFIKAGFNKLSNLDGTMKMFGSMGLLGWFGGFIGGAELLGGIGLLVPRTVRRAARRHGQGRAGPRIPAAAAGAAVAASARAAGSVANAR